MKKKLLSTLAAVSMLTNLVTPVLAAKPSHEGPTHYSYATGQEGLVTEANFLEESYTLQNGKSNDYLEELMAWVDDNTLAHELRYVEWYIENHDSNYPFSLESSTSGQVYCGFDSGTATLTAVITRDDGSLVKASTKLIASARTIQYATGFYFEDSSKTFYTGPQAIDDGTLVIKPTPDNAIFSDEQYAAIKAAVESTDNPLQLSLRGSNNLELSEGHRITPTISGTKTDSSTAWNGYSGYTEATITYPLGTSTVSTESDVTIGAFYLEIEPSSVSYTTDTVANIGGMRFECEESGAALAGGSLFVDDLIKASKTHDDYTITEVFPTNPQRNFENTSRFVKIQLDTADAKTRTTIVNNIANYVTDVDQPLDYANYSLNITEYNAQEDFDAYAHDESDFSEVQGMAMQDKHGIYQIWDLGTSYTHGNPAADAAAGDKNVEALNAFFNANATHEGDIQFTWSGVKTDNDASDLIFTVYDDTTTGTDSGTAKNNGGGRHTVDNWDEVKVYTTGDAVTTGISGKSLDTDYFSNNDYFTFKQESEYIWPAPVAYKASTTTTEGTNTNGLKSYTANYGTAAYDYELVVDGFRRYSGTQPIEVLDDVARSVRLNSNVAVQPSSLHQTSSITVAVGDVIDLTNHFKVTSTANVSHDIVYNEAFFNNDSSYAYNDYGVILEDDEEVLGVRVGKNKIVASVENSYTGDTHSAEVIVTVVPRTGITTTVTPTSSPLTVTPPTHTVALGGAGVQLAAKYFGESTFDVNDNVLPTLQSTSNGQIQDVVTFTSNDPTVLTVNEDGFVTPVGVGTGTVTVAVPNSDYEAVFTMTVVAPVIPQEDTSGGTSSGNTPVPSTGVNALGQLF